MGPRLCLLFHIVRFMMMIATSTRQRALPAASPLQRDQACILWMRGGGLTVVQIQVNFGLGRVTPLPGGTHQHARYSGLLDGTSKLFVERTSNSIREAAKDRNGFLLRVTASAGQVGWASHDGGRGGGGGRLAQHSLREAPHRRSHTRVSARKFASPGPTGPSPSAFSSSSSSSSSCPHFVGPLHTSHFCLRNGSEASTHTRAWRQSGPATQSISTLGAAWRPLVLAALEPIWKAAASFPG